MWFRQSGHVTFHNFNHFSTQDLWKTCPHESWLISASSLNSTKQTEHSCLVWQHKESYRTDGVRLLNSPM
ncbi:hypothetical protein HanXRQr2_Chr03g0113491 [Helianthus annuus]|uniref:Uncharacterized protein n=1 Tax=Helianthus annuus TaxID=4232 RepID=A0A9K3JGQ0_HELAN|nr:hypothetical protein HanXRQr2_Chr03g0113491 [Helianthus annuus]KAJ0943888.1 hypothetical protein HanPSC8_Chr03g0109891 [Helianthus annuus]